METCTTEGCSEPAKLQCPTCLKIGIKGSFFCNQACFKASWSTHKSVHKSANSTNNENDKPYNPWPHFHFTGKLRPGRVSPKRAIPAHIERPDYADHPEGVPISEQAMRGAEIKVLSEAEQEGVRKASILARECLDVALAAAKPGVTTDELDRLVHEAAIERNCYPSPLNYYKFPKSCCTSVNEVICHGIPDDRPLEDGDILNVDVTVYYGGFHGDLNETVFIGKVDDAVKKLVRVTYEALMKSIEACKPGMLYRDIGNIIQKHVHQNGGFSVVKSYCGHGIHRLFHTAPSVPHYAKNKAVGVMKPGHCFTIEPMISEGMWHDETWPDNWTAVTVDGKRSAQFEQTLLITDRGVEILTKRREKNGQPWFMDQLQAEEAQLDCGDKK